MSYDPLSIDAMFGKVMTRLDQQDSTLSKILDEVRKTNGRVSKIEREREVEKAKLAVIAAVVSCAVGAFGWALSVLLKH